MGPRVIGRSIFTIAGHSVTIYEAKDKPGGLNTYGMGDYKMKVQLSLDEVGMILDLGVELKTNVRFGRCKF